jgi:DNA-binding CsgD family transcriptional regulator/tetratricopeptide (TPR) repeat protein
MTTLLERDPELRRLSAALADARQGHGRVAFVSGEAGIGKTALVSAFAASAAGVRTAFGRCDALATPRALGPFLDLAAALHVAPVDDRDRLLGRLLDDLRRGTPALLVIEDVHWADDSTVELLVMLGRRAVDLALLLIVTYRDDEVPTDHPLRLAIGDLVTSSSTSWIGLRPLSPEAVQVLAAESNIEATNLYELTGGNPFYVTEVLAAPAEGVPTTVRMAVLARASRLSSPARAVLDAVSVVPGRAEPWLVDELCDPAPGAVAACVAAGVLVADDGAYAFRHELARLAVEAEVPAERRRDLHRRAVATLAARSDIDPARLAHHAEVAGDERTLAVAASEACRLAFARTAVREAVRHGEQALTVQHLLSADARAELKEYVGAALAMMARNKDAVGLLGEAAAHWQAAGSARREAVVRFRLTSALVSSGLTAQAMAATARAIEVLEREPPGAELAAAYAHRAAGHMLARDRDNAVAWGGRAIEMSRQLDDRNNLARALIQTGIADVMDARFEGLTRVREGIEIATREGLPAMVSLGLLQIGSGCGEMRRYDEAVPALVEGADFCDRHNLEDNRRYIIAWLARCRFDLGQWNEADAAARDALAGARGAAIARFVALNTLGWLRARRGEADVWPLLDEALEIARRTGHLQRLWPVAVARAEAGWFDRTLDDHVAILEEVLELAISCRHGIAAGEIGLWLARAGCIERAPAIAVDPFARWIDGDHLGAAAGFRRMGCPYEAASALADAGNTGSLREALATFTRLGATPMVDEVVSRLRARGVRVPSRPRAVALDGRPAGLSPREHEVLKLVAAGFTNPQIASSLYISRKTAEHHVSSILVKLGVGSRTEAAAAAVRLGLTAE